MWWLAHKTNKLENEDVIKVRKTKCQHCTNGFKQVTNFTKQKLQEIGAKFHKAPTKEEMIIAKNIEVSISHGNLQKFFKNETLPNIVVENVNKLGNYCHQEKEASMSMKTFAYNQLQNGKHVVEYIKASKNIEKMKRRLYKSKLQKSMNKIKDNHFQ